MDYFVLFLDAETGKHIYSLFPGSEFPWPGAEDGGTFAIPLVTVRNVDGPDVFVSVWTFSLETTVVECGEEQVITSPAGGYFSLKVRDASSSESLFESEQIEASHVWTMLVRRDGVILGHDLVSSTPAPSGDACG